MSSTYSQNSDAEDLDRFPDVRLTLLVAVMFADDRAAQLSGYWKTSHDADFVLISTSGY